MADTNKTRAGRKRFADPKSLNRVKKNSWKAGTIPGACASSRQPVIPPAPLTGDVGRGCGDASRALLVSPQRSKSSVENPVFVPAGPLPFAVTVSRGFGSPWCVRTRGVGLVVENGRRNHVPMSVGASDENREPQAPLGERLHHQGRERSQLVSGKPVPFARIDRRGRRETLLCDYRHRRRCLTSCRQPRRKRF